MKITISGYGRMGHEIEKAALKLGHPISAIVDNTDDWESNKENISLSDVIIDFSFPESATDNIRRAFDLGIPMVTGTTGWLDELPEFKDQCNKEGKTLFFAPNFSLGVNILFALSEKLAVMMNNLDDYQPAIREVHHIHKLDAPSGTAIAIANGMIKNLDSKTNWIAGYSEVEKDLSVYSERIGEVPGLHEVVYTSQVDRIRIEHEAFGREGFAYGAIYAAQWVQGKSGYFEMKDMLEL